MSFNQNEIYSNLNTIHFEVTEDIYKNLSKQYPLEKFIDIVYDRRNGENLQFLDDKEYWYVQRIYQDSLCKKERKLIVDKSNNYKELPFDKDINDSLDLPFPNYDPIFGLETTRICILPNLWIDFSSWLNFGNFGAYVVGTALEVSPVSLLGLNSIHLVASKYLVCDFNTNKKLFFDKIPNPEIVLEQLTRYPVKEYIDRDGSFYKIHPYDKNSLQNQNSDQDFE